MPHLQKRVYPGMNDESFQTNQLSDDKMVLEQTESAKPNANPFGHVVKDNS